MWKRNPITSSAYDEEKLCYLCVNGDLKMLYSKEMLHVAETALEMLEVVEERNQVEVLWLAAITSLRAVGHVLDKTDKSNNPQLAPVIDQWWRELKASKANGENGIFHNFIDAERNDTIKEFCLHYSDDPQNVIVLQKSDKETTAREFVLDNLLFIPMKDGPFMGEDIRDMISESIKWWKQQFTKMAL